MDRRRKLSEHIASRRTATLNEAIKVNITNLLETLARREAAIKDAKEKQREEEQRTDALTRLLTEQLQIVEEGEFEITKISAGAKQEQPNSAKDHGVLPTNQQNRRQPQTHGGAQRQFSPVPTSKLPPGNLPKD